MAERPIHPNTLDNIRAWIEVHAGEQFVALPGAIQSYDPVHQVADVVAGVRNPYTDPNGSAEIMREDLPVFAHVPVLFPRCGPWFMAMSIEPGTKVQLLVNTLEIAHWRVGDGSVVDVGDTRRQHPAHAVALIGLDIANNHLRHAPPFIAATDPDAGLTFGSDLDAGTRQKIKGDGALLVEHGTTPVFRIEPEPPPPVPESEEDPEPPLPAPEFVALAAKVDAMFSDLRAAFDAWTVSPNDGGAALKVALESWSPTTVAARRVKAT